MATESVQQLYGNKQASKEGGRSMVSRNLIFNKAFITTVHSIIRENAVYKNGSLSLNAYELNDYDKRTLLSYLVSAHDFIWLTNNESRKQAAYLDYIDEMNYFIDREIDEVWHETMTEMGLLKRIDNENGECYYIRN